MKAFLRLLSQPCNSLSRSPVKCLAPGRISSLVTFCRRSDNRLVQTSTLPTRANKTTFHGSPLKHQVTFLHGSEIYLARKIVKAAQKLEKSRERSAELLKILRKKRLEGLANPRPQLTPEEKLTKRIEWLPSIKKLLIFYWARVKSKRDLTPVQKFAVIKCIAKYFSTDTQMRDVFLEHELQQRFFQMFVQDIRANLDAYDAHQLQKIVVYMAKLCVTDSVIYGNLARAILHCNLRDYSTKELSQLCWAFAKYHPDVDKIFEALDKEIFSRDLSDFNSAELCTIVWSFAEYGILDKPEFYLALGNEILSRDLSQFQPWMLASFVFAYSKVDPLKEKVLKMVEEELHQRGELKPFGTNDLAMVVIAFARNGKLQPRLFRKLEVVMMKRRDYKETLTIEHLQEMYDLLKASKFHLAQIRKIIEKYLYPDKVNSIFDILYRPRRAWKEKVFHQTQFKAY
ncbi:uncharacterized protein [Montipora foliosa]|uniref:uncharacterized protein n=1 Tax=Montipora foliosa TaxID=591990 RepID=UPI0035F13F11